MYTIETSLEKEPSRSFFVLVAGMQRKNRPEEEPENYWQNMMSDVCSLEKPNYTEIQYGNLLTATPLAGVKFQNLYT